ncbi:MAG: M6 family metalloprotease domain-containing protein [Melioribacteraceae bacterium]
MKDSLTSRILKSISLQLLLFLFFSSVNKGQISPHPELLKRVQADKSLSESIYYFKNAKELAAKGIDAPWAAPELSINRNFGLNNFQRSYGPAKTPTGNWNALVILVKFSDKPSQTEPAFFDQLLFGTQFGSMRDYYRKVSYNQLDIVTVNLPGTTGWFTAPQPYSYYVAGANGQGIYPRNAQKLVEDVVQLADPTVDFSKYDNDNDGYVDALFIVHTGPGAELTGKNDDIWSHAWEVKTIQNVDGVKVKRYSTEPEYWKTPGDLTMGVYAHELAHAAFGVPDLYDRDYSSSGLGKWSLMAAGSWNGTAPGGNYPAFPDAFIHAQMGYINPTVITANSLALLIPQIETNSKAYLLWKNGNFTKEYFLIENRQKVDYDKYIPGDGLLVYHIDQNITQQNDKEWYPGLLLSQHYLVALEQADGLWNLEKKDNSGDAADPFPGTGNKTSFTSSSTPNTKDYLLTSTGLSIKNIGVSGSNMTADFEVSTTEIVLKVVTPNGGESWPVGYTKQIIIDGLNTGIVKVEYTTDNGNTWNLIDNVNPSVNLKHSAVLSAKGIGLNESYVQNITGSGITWVVPNSPSNQCKIRATAVNNSSLTDVSDNSFSIIPVLTGQFSVQFNYDAIAVTGSNGNLGAIFIPSLNEFWTSRWNSNLMHRWTKTGSLKEEFSIDEVTGVVNFAYDGINLYAAQIESDKIKIINPFMKTAIGEITAPFKVLYITYDPNADNSNGGFWIGDFSTNPTLINRNGTVLRTLSYSSLGSRANMGIAFDNHSPGGPYLWFASQSPYQSLIQVKVSTGLPTGVEHDLSTDVGTGVNNLANGGIFISTGIVNGKATIGGMLQGYPNNLYGYQLSDLVPHITVSYPNGGEKLKVGSQSDIIWSSGLVNKVKIEYSINNGLDWQLVADNLTTSTGKYTWVVPNNLSTNCKVRISDKSSAALNDVSDAVFSIATTAIISEMEPNNTRLQAMSIVYADTVNASIMPIGDIDYYKIQAVAGDTLMFYAENRNSAQLLGNMSLLDQNGNDINRYIQSFTRNSYKQRYVYVIPNTATYYVRYSFRNNMSGMPAQNEEKVSYLMIEHPTNPKLLEGPPNDYGDYQIIFNYFKKAAPLAGSTTTTDLNSNTTRFYGRFVPNGLPTSATIEYGTTTSYGSSIVLSTGTNNLNESEGTSDKASGLLPNTVYHFRMKVENAKGIAYAIDDTFTTPATPDGWTSINSPTTSQQRTIKFYDSNIGYSFGPWVWMKTTDGGYTWVIKSTNYRYNSIEVIDANTVIAVGSNRIVSKTSDGGTSWTDLQIGCANNLGVSFKDTNNGVVVTSCGELYKTTNGGGTWNKLDLGVTNQDLNTVKYFSNNTIVASGRERYIIRSTNDGNTWTVQQLSGNSSALWSMSFKDLNNGIIVGEGGMVFKTTDGGATWISINSGHTNTQYGVNYESNGVVVSVGQDGTIYKSGDDGATWTKQQSGTTNSLYGINTLGNSSTLFSVGDWGTILKYSSNTSVIALPTKPVLVSPTTNQVDQPKDITFKWNKVKDAEKNFVQLSKDQTFTIIGKNDSTATDTTKTITNLSEGQKYYWRVQAKNIVGISPWSDTWNFTTQITSPSNLTLQRTGLKEITLKWNDNSNNEDGYIIERKQTPQPNYSFFDSLKTTTITYLDNKVEQGPTYYYRVRAYTKYAQSDYSNEASLVMVGIEKDNKIPTEYLLFQNYPNPFNPTTKMKFGLPERTNAKLTVYDILGRAISTLVDGELEAGYHEVNFDASNLPSGVYFYQLTTPNYNSTKKLLLIK